MTNELFWELYDNGKIQVKIYSGVVDDTEKSIEAFEYNGKFYLRIHSVHKYVTGERRFGKQYRMSKESHYIKEFDTRRHANRYFKKAAQGLARVI